MAFTFWRRKKSSPFREAAASLNRKIIDLATQ
jgi:hypothetical protein